ncbi:ABC transporter ATP-binding protein [Thermotalea metallivorans]|uniref:Putative multidrug resistance ABC transporter ATP-binding/permease protein YheI n=1 Tax=Thermotalea metallivorans TaxID=520762 RepID=A0A140L9H8_9FIRM|nr:ABC transporter ATP-binding protein [Thermotalea metallivorans]KXG77203.1 putative multidrug resistance ABC transporter ATP-binding/permease protein YheI [Thermotalea metallivorans]
MENFKTLKDFILRHKWFYIFGIVSLLLVDGLQLFIPEILRNFTDTLSRGEITTDLFIRYCIGLLSLAIIIAILRYFWRMLIMGTSRHMEYYLRDRMFKHLQHLSIDYFHHHKAGDLMARATNDINAVKMAMGMGVVMITDAFFLTAAILFRMVATIDMKLVISALLPLPLLVVVVLYFGKSIHNRFRAVQEAFSKLTEKVQENISGIRVVKSFVQESFEIQKFTDANQYLFNKNMDLVKIHGLFHPLIALITSLSYGIVLWYGSILVVKNIITLGDFVAFNSYLAILAWPIMALGWVINILQRGSASMSRINEILHAKPDIIEGKNAIHKETLEGEISIENLHFRYPGTSRYVLRDINIHIPPGNSLGIIGRTGSGKSTLLHLILRLYEIEEGIIQIDGINIKDLSLDTLRKHIGVVEQESFLFSTSIKDNITFGDPNFKMEDVVAAAKIAQIHDNIMNFPHQYDTLVGERGVTLSGGQKQRTCIARTIIRKPRLLFLDDCLSAVDTQTEEKILQGLQEIMKQKTNIIIAHRISTIKHCDEIIVLDEGKIVERGTHETLIQKDGLYRQIYEKQLLEEQISIE